LGKPSYGLSWRDEGGVVGVLALDDAGEMIDLLSEDVAEFEGGLAGRVVESFTESSEELGEEDAAADGGEVDAFGGGRRIGNPSHGVVGRGRGRIGNRRGG
jgi:hypothetical protein